jgi:hypothetical protein
MTRHKDKAILYWFGPPESKTLHPVLWFVLLLWWNYMTTCPWEDALACLILGDGQGRWTGVQVGYNRETYLESVTTSKAYPSCLNPFRLPCLARQVVFTSLGPHVRSDRPTDRSAGLLVGRTHLSGPAVSLVGGDPGVPMSHTFFPHLSFHALVLIKLLFASYLD